MEEENFNSNEEQTEKELTPEERLHPRISPVAAAFLALFGILVLYQGMGGVLTIVVLGADLNKIDPTQLRLMTIAGQMLFILLPTLVLSRAVYTDVTTIIRFKMPRISELALFFVGFIIITPAIQNISYIQSWIIEKLAAGGGAFKEVKDFFDSMDKLVGDSYGNFLSAKSFFDVFIIIIAVSITPAICEELFFRGFIQKSFELKWKPAASIIVSSLVFALYHFSPYGLIPLFALSLFLGYAAYKTNSVLVPVFIHFANNLFMVILYFIVGDEAMNARPEAGPAISSYFVFLFVNIIFLAAWLYFVKRFYKKPVTI